MKYAELHSHCIPIENVYFLKQYHQKIMVNYLWTYFFTRMHFLFNFLRIYLPLIQLLIWMKKFLLQNQICGRVLPQSDVRHLVFRTGKFRMKQLSLKSKEDHYFGSSAKQRKGF